MRERLGVRPQVLEWGSLVQDGTRPETISDLLKTKPTAYLTIYLREKTYPR